MAARNMFLVHLSFSHFIDSRKSSQSLIDTHFLSAFIYILFIIFRCWNLFGRANSGSRMSYIMHLEVGSDWLRTAVFGRDCGRFWDGRDCGRFWCLMWTVLLFVNFIFESNVRYIFIDDHWQPEVIFKVYKIICLYRVHRQLTSATDSTDTTPGAPTNSKGGFFFLQPIDRPWSLL